MTQIGVTFDNQSFWNPKFGAPATAFMQSNICNIYVLYIIKLVKALHFTNGKLFLINRRKILNLHKLINQIITDFIQAIYLLLSLCCAYLPSKQGKKQPSSQLCATSFHITCSTLSPTSPAYTWPRPINTLLRIN